MIPSWEPEAALAVILCRKHVLKRKQTRVSSTDIFLIHTLCPYLILSSIGCLSKSRKSIFAVVFLRIIRSKVRREGHHETRLFDKGQVFTQTLQGPEVKGVTSRQDFLQGLCRRGRTR